jgi:hypothetical protein
MTVRLTQAGTIELDGVCTLEDAEKLQQYLLSDPKAAVDWRSCTGAHTSVIQILLAARPTLLGPPQNDFLRNCVNPLLETLAM